MKRIVPVLLILVGVFGVVALQAVVYELGVAHAQSGSGSGSAVVIPPAENVLGDPTGAVAQIESLFRGGSLLGAGALLVYVVLAFVAKLDPKRAFYWTFGLSVAGVLAEGLANGRTPNIGMLIGLAIPFIAVVAKGPELIAKKTEGT